MKFDLSQIQHLKDEIGSFFDQTKKPFVIASWGMSLDGKTVTHAQDSRQISSNKALQHCHQIRNAVDAILVGSKTAIEDDPLLTVRLNGNTEIKHPKRVILASKGILPPTLKILNSELPGKTIIATISKNKLRTFAKHIEIIHVQKNDQGLVDLSSLLILLGQQGIKSLLVEGGMTVLQSFFRENLVNKINVYLSPVIIGDLPKKQYLSDMHLSTLDNDFLITTRVG